VKSYLKTNIQKLFGALADRFYGDRRYLTMALTTVFLQQNSKLDKINNPFHHIELCFELFSVLPTSVKKVKWKAIDEDEELRRFNRLCNQLNEGLPSYRSDLALELMQIENAFSGMTNDMPGAGADVAWHFLASSSFAFKGKLLFNVVRFMRPVNCLEIGTGWGMSAYFILQALESYSANGNLWTIEANDLVYEKSKSILGQRFGERVSCIHGFSNDRLPEITRHVNRIDFYFHDGGHVFENIVGNFELVKPFLKKSSVLLIDDIRWWDRTMRKEDPRCYPAWERIYQDPMVRCAIEVNGTLGMALIG
jgi:predicted O-methyltransferase YrrM